jgi:hypothetical protein
MSVNFLVQELQQEPFDPILIYKPQGMLKEECPTLSRDSFVLAVQTEFQVELYRKFSNKILCIDATHTTNAYRFKLITCMVPDEFGQGRSFPIINKISSVITPAGQPIAWCISDQETTEVMELFLQSIKNRSPLSTVSVLMTDDGIVLDLEYGFLLYGSPGGSTI